jgi:hypothetical protein
MVRAADPWVFRRARSGYGLLRVERLRALMLPEERLPTVKEQETGHIVDTREPELGVVHRIQSLRMGAES